MFDAHRHDEFSFFDGSGKAIELAQLAKEKGYTASGLIQHYDACKAVGLKPVLGVEAYFLPVYKENKRGFHLCLYAKNLEGYKNINAIQSEGEKQKYYNPIITFEILKKYSEGVICSTACVAGFLAQCIINNKHLQAKKFLKRMLKIFGDDLYIEIQPYKVSEKGLQERVNVEAIKLAEEFGIKCIFTSDSHRGRKEDLESYIAMHMLKNKNPEYVNHIRNTYSARYMPNKDEMQKRFLKMHENDLGIAKCKRIIAEVERNMDEFEEKVEGDIIDQLASVYSLPKFDEEKNSYVLLKSKVKEGLKEKGLYRKNYIKRALEELKVIKSNNFEDYFLIVQDYVKYAKNKGIVVGVGRGSGCNCLINYALGITEVDPIIFGLDYKRFIREDKKQLPDIDVDFETDRRNEVIEYMVNKYKGHAVQIASYGMYKVDNLVNDVVKLYDEMEKEDIKNIKKLVNDHKDSEKMVDIEKLKSNSLAKKYNAKYNGIIDNFCFLYNKVKYIGTHAAGVAVSKLPIYYYTAVRYDKKSNKYFSSYNLVDLERIGIIKYDMLGLNTLNSLKDYAEKSGVKPDILDMIKDKKILNKFACGNSDGVFQFDSHAAQSILKQINVDSFKDVVAANAMDRPGPLSLGIPEKYAMAKETWIEKENKPVYSKYINDTYGCILYQEQVNSIAVEYGGLNWNQADKLRKMDDPGSFKARKLLEQYHDEFLNVFIRGMKKHGVGRSEASELFGKFLNYTFNKGHAVGYTLISFYEMFYKVYYNTIFWQVKLKYCSDENEWKFQNLAVKDGALILTPHVNGSAYYSIANVDNEDCILMGISSIKGVGDKVAKSIEEERKKNGNYKDIDDLCDRLPKRIITSRVKEALKENGACIFDKKRYFDHVMRYNIELASR